MKIPVYSIEQDHDYIKKQIKEWETILDRIVDYYPNLPGDVILELENVRHEMMSINL